MPGAVFLQLTNRTHARLHWGPTPPVRNILFKKRTARRCVYNLHGEDLEQVNKSRHNNKSADTTHTTGTLRHKIASGKSKFYLILLELSLVGLFLDKHV